MKIKDLLLMISLIFLFLLCPGKGISSSRVPEKHMVYGMQLFRHGVRNPYYSEVNYTEKLEKTHMMHALAPKGIAQAYLLGKSTWKKYQNLLFRNTSSAHQYFHHKISVRTSTSMRAIQSTQAYLMGFS